MGGTTKTELMVIKITNSFVENWALGRVMVAQIKKTGRSRFSNPIISLLQVIQPVQP